MYKILALLLFTTLFKTGFSQDTLPKVSVKNSSNQIIISWKNNYGAKVSTINIQRSKDSLKNFVTIGSVLNPLNRENGYVDHKANAASMYYRVFVAFEGGTYLFSAAHRPVADTFHITLKPSDNNIETMPSAPEMIDVIKTDPSISLPSVIPPEPVAEESLDNFLPKIKIPKIVIPTGFVPSKYIFTNKENNLILNLPDAEILKYSLKFFDDKNTPILEIKKITESFLVLEKVNFLHSGWFTYQLFEDGLFLEKYKFYISKEARYSSTQILKGNR